MITNVGQRLGERYVLQERLAVGGMGEVWSAIDEVLNRPVAVKVLRTDLAPDAAFQQRFRAEARTAAGLSHGGIAAVYDYGEMLGSAYLVMELVPGEPLSQMIADQGALGTDRTLQIVSQAARALHAAHRHGVIHRDIKPANLMVTPELRVKVTDFGIARPRDHEPLTATGQVMGTAHYLAPELARGEIASPLSDVYALGVVAYECLAGWRPFEGDNQVAVATAHLQDEPPPLPQTIPAPVRAIVEASMSKNPAGRPQGANVLAGLLEDLRLRGLAHGVEHLTAAAAPASAWPSDADTPPRGSQPPPATTRRQAALDRAGTPPDRAPRSDRGQRPYSSDPSGPDDRYAGGYSNDRYRNDPYPGSGRPGSGYPNERPTSGYPNSGYQNSGHPDSGYSDSGYSDPNYPEAQDPIPGFPIGGQAAFAPEARARPRGSHSSRSAPSPGPYPQERSSGQPPRRKLSIPLIALAVLIVLVVVGALLAHHHGSSSSHSMGPYRTSAGFSSAPQAVTSG